MGRFRSCGSKPPKGLRMKNNRTTRVKKHLQKARVETQQDAGEALGCANPSFRQARQVRASSGEAARSRRHLEGRR
jgi:hypothetical protein